MVSCPAYVRGMRAAKKSFRIALTLAGLTAMFGVAQMGQASASAHRTYTVRPYDTVWTIANRFYSSGITAATVLRIEQANHIRGALIRPGQTLLLP
jgi:nucleoid-associated protein YgaU